MNVTLNFYSGRKYNYEDVKEQVTDKNPVVFIIPKKDNDSVYSMINISNDLKKYMCLSHSFDTPKVVAFLLSFDNIENSNVLMMAPSNKKDSTMLFIKRVLSCINTAKMCRKLKIKK